MKKKAEIFLFIISYLPLYLILFVQNINDDIYDKDTKEMFELIVILKLNMSSIFFLILSLISVFAYFFFFRAILQLSHEKHIIKEIKSDCYGHLSYLATYILPFIGLKLDSWQNLLATIILFCVLGYINIRTNMILTNPTLTFFGYNISEVIDSEDKKKLIIYKGKLNKNKELNISLLVKNIYILKTKNKKK